MSEIRRTLPGRDRYPVEAVWRARGVLDAFHPEGELPRLSELAARCAAALGWIGFHDNRYRQVVKGLAAESIGKMRAGGDAPLRWVAVRHAVPGARGSARVYVTLYVRKACFASRPCLYLTTNAW